MDCILWEKLWISWCSNLKGGSGSFKPRILVLIDGESCRICDLCFQVNNCMLIIKYEYNFIIFLKVVLEKKGGYGWCNV